jgi:hypothetical protein
MNKVKEVAIKVKNHVKRNKVAYALGGVAAAAIALQQSNRKAFVEFLKEKGINPDEYFAPDYLEFVSEIKEGS